MAANASEIEISFEIRSHNQVVRKVSLVIQKLPDDSSQDTHRAIKKYRSDLVDDSERSVQDWYVNDVQVLYAFLLSQLQKIIDHTNHHESQIIITKDPARLLALQNCYCQHCGRLFLQHYGPIAGVIKKCSSCRKYTSCSHQKATSNEV